MIEETPGKVKGAMQRSAARLEQAQGQGAQRRQLREARAARPRPHLARAKHLPVSAAQRELDEAVVQVNAALQLVSAARRGEARKGEAQRGEIERERRGERRSHEHALVAFDSAHAKGTGQKREARDGTHKSCAVIGTAPRAPQDG